MTQAKFTAHSPRPPHRALPVLALSSCLFAAAPSAPAQAPPTDAPPTGAPPAVAPPAAAPPRGTARPAAPAPAKPAAPAVPGKQTVRTMDASEYVQRLDQLGAAVREPTARRAIIQRAAPRAGRVRRADGGVQSVNNEQLHRGLAKALKDGSLPRRHAETIGESVQARRDEAARWKAGSYAPADAGSIVAGLVKDGSIRVGPTALQLWWKDVMKSVGDLLERIGKWVFGRAPSVRPAKMPSIDPAWVKFFFYSTVFSLLAIIGYMVWKALGGRIGRRERRAEDRVLEGEDAELLKLPSDELLDRAARFAGGSNYREAVRHRFIATLVRFDERALWRYNTRRTNREHIALLRDSAARTALAAPLESLARRFDRVRYGDAQASHADWIRFDADATALESMDAARADFGSMPGTKARPGSRGTGGART